MLGFTGEPLGIAGPTTVCGPVVVPVTGELVPSARDPSGTSKASRGSTRSVENTWLVTKGRLLVDSGAKRRARKPRLHCGPSGWLSYRSGQADSLCWGNCFS